MFVEAHTVSPYNLCSVLDPEFLLHQWQPCWWCCLWTGNLNRVWFAFQEFCFFKGIAKQNIPESKCVLFCFLRWERMALKILIIYSFMKINLPLSTLILHWGYIINTNPIPAILALWLSREANVPSYGLEQNANSSHLSVTKRTWGNHLTLDLWWLFLIWGWESLTFPVGNSTEFLENASTCKILRPVCSAGILIS